MSSYFFYELASQPNEYGYSTIQILKTGKFTDSARYGEFEITERDIDDILHNFERFRMAGRLFADYNHGSAKADATPDQAKAAGRVQKLIKKGKDKLFAVVQWTEEAMQRIKAGEYNFISPEFHPNYPHPEKGGKKMGAWLLAIALTNRPFLKGMEPVALSEAAASTFNPSKKEDVMPDPNTPPEGGDDKSKALTEAQAEVKTLTEQVKDAKAKADALEAEKADLAKQLEEARQGETEQTKLLRDAMAEQTKALEETVKRLSDLESETKAKDAERRLDEAVRTHKLSKAERDSEVYKKLALTDPDTFDAIVAAKPEVVPTAPDGGDGEGPQGADAQAVQFTELVAKREEELKAKSPDTSDRHIYARALREVTAENPTLAALGGQSI